MKTATTIAERDAIKGVIMWALVSDNLWHGYETPAEIPLALRPPVKTPQEIATEIAAREAAELKLAVDAEAARQYPKMQALTQLSPAEARAWVGANVTNLAEAKDAIATLFALCCVLGRRL